MSHHRETVDYGTLRLVLVCRECSERFAHSVVRHDDATRSECPRCSTVGRIGTVFDYTEHYVAADPDSRHPTILTEWGDRRLLRPVESVGDYVARFVPGSTPIEYVANERGVGRRRVVSNARKYARVNFPDSDKAKYLSHD